MSDKNLFIFKQFSGFVDMIISKIITHNLYDISKINAENILNNPEKFSNNYLPPTEMIARYLYSEILKSIQNIFKNSSIIIFDNTVGQDYLNSIKTLPIELGFLLNNYSKIFLKYLEIDNYTIFAKGPKTYIENLIETEKNTNNKICNINFLVQKLYGLQENYYIKNEYEDFKFNPNILCIKQRTEFPTIDQTNAEKTLKLGFIFYEKKNEDGHIWALSDLIKKFYENDYNWINYNILRKTINLAVEQIIKNIKTNLFPTNNDSQEKENHLRDLLINIIKTNGFKEITKKFITTNNDINIYDNIRPVLIIKREKDGDNLNALELSEDLANKLLFSFKWRIGFKNFIKKTSTIVSNILTYKYILYNLKTELVKADITEVSDYLEKNISFKKFNIKKIAFGLFFD